MGDRAGFRAASRHKATTSSQRLDAACCDDELKYKTLRSSRDLLLTGKNTLFKLHRYFSLNLRAASTCYSARRAGRGSPGCCAAPQFWSRTTKIPPTRETTYKITAKYSITNTWSISNTSSVKISRSGKELESFRRNISRTMDSKFHIPAKEILS